MKLLALADDWSVTMEAFRRALLETWPETMISELPTSEAYSMRWEGPDRDLAEGRLSRDGTAIALEGTLEGCARVTAWFRGLVPANVAVTFFDQGYNADVEISPGMTAEAVASAYRLAAG